ncbi:hypothetical protein LTR27_006299 [Elasticomyces elasticus]|nr:hypothetical protein LTR27_006299 [Elasticomyces elasticus]
MSSTLRTLKQVQDKKYQMVKNHDTAERNRSATLEITDSDFVAGGVMGINPVVVPRGFAEESIELRVVYISHTDGLTLALHKKTKEATEDEALDRDVLDADSPIIPSFHQISHRQRRCFRPTRPTATTKPALLGQTFQG